MNATEWEELDGPSTNGENEEKVANFCFMANEQDEPSSPANHQDSARHSCCREGPPVQIGCQHKLSRDPLQLHHNPTIRTSTTQQLSGDSFSFFFFPCQQPPPPSAITTLSPSSIPQPSSKSSHLHLADEPAIPVTFSSNRRTPSQTFHRHLRLLSSPVTFSATISKPGGHNQQQPPHHCRRSSRFLRPTRISFICRGK
ncbi:uncharacterized protein LOC131153031 [Malania oleifera]|uniref:uncharacterized protein LOC131153031 n=1 Tax=Malania oleifera TaxID=397392 RepID=UPI0025AEA978|nr:uncharacterized protein LOC131153031 [Malania oleifera]